MGISVKIIADSISKDEMRITSFELEYPRFIHSELMTHRIFSRNSASSRAIPIEKMISFVEENCATPEHWGKNNPGMVSKKELSEEEKQKAKDIWYESRDKMIFYVKKLIEETNGHKQWINRLIEPFFHIKIILTSTNFSNFFWLRNHCDAQPEIKILAEKMQNALIDSKPIFLEKNQWHLPYVKTNIINNKAKYFVDEKEYDFHDALRISVSCCAQVSYRKNDLTLEKANKIYKMLNLNDEINPPHYSPCEHQAKPMEKNIIKEKEYNSFDFSSLEEGVTHVDRHGFFWSNNFRGWIQYRALLENKFVV